MKPYLHNVLIWILIFTLSLLNVNTGYCINAGSLEKGLVGRWSLSQESLKGSNYGDSTPSANDATPTGTVSATTDRKGQSNKAVNVAGTNDYLSITAKNLGTTHSICFWIKPTSESSLDYFLSGNPVGTDYIGIDTSGDERILYNATNTAAFSVTSKTLLNNWTHIVITRSSTTVNLYVDGVLENSPQTLGGDVALDIDTFFAANDGTGDYEGDANDIRFYDRVLSQAEVTTLYNTYQTGSLKAGSQLEGFVGHWSLDKEDTTTGTTDLITNGGFDADTDWTKGTGWSIAAGVASCDGSQAANTLLFQSTPLIAGETYSTTFTVSNYSAGNIQISAGATGAGTNRSANGTYTEVLTAAPDGVLYMRGDSNFVGDIDNVIVYDTTGNIVDLTPYENAGASATSPTWTTDRKGQSNKALSFNGTTDCIDLGVITPFAFGANDFSISLWLQNDTSAVATCILSSWENAGGSDRGIQLSKAAGDIIGFYARVSAGDEIDILGSTSIDTSSWYNIVITRTGGVATLYVNGVLDKTDTSAGGTINTSTVTALIGALWQTGAAAKQNYFNGKISDVRIYNRALSQAEVTTLYNTYQTGSIKAGSLTKGLGGHWKLSAESLKGTNYGDNTPYGNDGVPTASPTATTDRKGQSNKALSFNGSTQYVSLTASDFITDFGSDTTGSINMWVKTSVAASTNRPFGVSDTSASIDYMTFLVSTTTGLMNFWLNDGTLKISLQSTTNVADGNWHMITVTQTGSVSTLYIDAVSEDTDSGEWLADLSNLDTFHIGGVNINSTQYYWNGDLDDMRYYSGRALTQAEVTLLYETYE